MDSYEFFFNDQNRITESYEAGEYLFLSGTPAIGVFFICSGKVQILTQTEDGFLVKEIKSAGDILGLDEIEFIYYVSDAVALEKTEVYFFDRYFLQEMT